MRRFLLLTIATMMTISMMAIGAGNGKDKANAIDFDWANGHKPALSAGSWYRVSLSHMKSEANDPTLALYLTNLTDETSSVSLTLQASLYGESVNQKSSYNIAANDYQLWSKQNFEYDGRVLSLKQLMAMGLSEVYLQLTSNKEIALSAKVYETEDIVDDACSKAKEFNWAGVSVPAGEQWYRLNLTDVKNSGNELKFVVANNGGAAANVAFDMSLDCPASAVIEKDWVIAAGAEKKEDFGRVFLDFLNEDYIFVKLTTDQPLTFRVEEEVIVVDPTNPNPYEDFNCATASELLFDKEMNLTAGKHVYKVKRAELIAERDFDTEFHVTNNTSVAANLAVEVAFACPVKSVVTQNLEIGAHESIMKLVKGDMLKTVNSEWVYIRFITDQDLTATVGMRNVSPCANATPFDWTAGADLAAGTSEWFVVDIAALKQNKQHLTLGITNYSDATALVNVEVALDCNGTILPMTLPVIGGMNVSQTIDYQLLAKAPLNRIYVGVSTDSHIKIASSVKNAIATDKTPCLNAINPEHGVEYTQKANTTQWYKLSLDLLESTTDYSSIYLASKGSSRAHVTLGVVTDCQYTTSTKVTIPVPAGVSFGALAPNVLGKVLKELARFEGVYNKVDSKDLYVEVYTDQPIGFGLDVVNATTNPCLREDLVTFDWNKGAKIQAGTPVWYDVDLTTIKNTGKHVKLTFTNHTDSLVWAATVVSVDCPAKLTMPLVLPVPAGMSIDKFIDYQYFAVPNVDNIYVGVVTDGALEMAATTYNAVITPSADCLNAVEVTSDFSYIQSAGSQWYKFPMGLLNDGGHAGKISFRNLGTETATLTAGVTVGCEYAIPTYGKVKMPKELAFSLAIPTSMLAKARKFIDADITEFYMQLTSDQDIVVALNMDASDLTVCSTAVPFDWNNWEKNGLQLQANQDIWYEVNLRYPWEKMKKGEDLVLSITNNNNVSVDFEAALSPTCPVFFALESYATIPANVTAQQVIEFSKLAEFLKQFDRELYNDETALIIEKYNAYVVLNKIDAKLGKYGKYFPVSKLEAILDQYGQYVAYAELKNLIDNREKYLSKAEIKTRLEEAKELLKDKAQEKLSIDQAIQVIDKLDAYIPYVEAETILKNYDQFLPYAAGAVTLLKKCEKYIPTDEIKQIVVKAKNAIPMDKIRALFEKIEARLPRDLNCYMRIKTTGDIIVEPDTIVPAPEGCADAIGYVWGTDVVVNEEAWYKVSIADVRNKDCSIILTVTNNSADSVKADLSLYENCDDDQAFLTMKNVGIAPNTTRSKTISASDLPGDIDVIYLYVQPYGEMTINLSTDCPVFKYEYATVASYACGTEVLTWNDTVHVNSYLDSVYTYVVTPLAAPVAMNDSILATIPGAKPQLTPGTTPDMTASADSIKAYYLAQDNESLADVVKVEWAATPIACGATTHTMTLTVEDECGNQQTADFTLNVTTPTLDVTNHTVTICATELPYTWNGITYPTAGTHTTILSNIYGCDSAQVNMTINLYPAIPETVVDTTICHGESYTWNLNKQTYNQTGSDTVTVASINGCDSVVILNLTVLPEIVSYDTVTVCYGDTYHWAEANLDCKRKGDYQYTFTSVEGCDSVANLHVKWLPKVEYKPDTVVTICYDQIPYVWMGNPYSATGIYKDTTLNYLGCDSIIHTLDLTVLPATVTAPTEYQTINQGESYTWPRNNQTYIAQGVYTHVEPNALGCDGIIYTLDLTVIPTHVVETKTITEFVCDGTEYVDPITGKKHIISSLIPSTQTWSDTVVVSPTLDSIYTYVITPIVAPVKLTDSIIATISDAIPVLKQGDLPVVDASVAAIKAYYQGIDTETISDVVTVTWEDVTSVIPCDATTYTMTLVVKDECDNVLGTTFVFNVEARTVTQTITSATVCYGGSYHWGITGKDYLLAGEYRDTLRTANGCDQEIRILNLTVLPEAKEVTTTKTICAGETFTWLEGDGQPYAVTTIGKVYTVQYAGTTCDSLVATLNLTVLPEAKEVTTTKTICAGETFTWSEGDGQPYAVTTIGKVYTVQYAGTTCDSLVATLNLTVLPEAKVETEEWTLCPGDLSTPRDWHGQSISAAGNYEAIEKFAGTDCDSVIYQLTVIIPDADNNATMDNLPAVSKYNNRIIMLNLNEIKDMFGGWSPAEADVQWFRVVGTQDAAYAAWNKLGDDEPLAKGHYYNLPDGGTLPAGQYYALVWRSSDVCEGGEIMRTVLITCGVDASGPRLVPNVVRANETLTLENLNPSDVNEVRVYSSTGQLVATYTAEQVSKFIFNAATVSGYYLVDVENKNNKVTLRYVVK